MEIRHDPSMLEDPNPPSISSLKEKHAYENIKLQLISRKTERIWNDQNLLGYTGSEI